MNETEIIVKDQRQSCVSGQDGRLYPREGEGLREALTSFDQGTPRGKAMILAGSNPGDIEFDKHGVADIVAVHWMIFAETGENPESGEVGSWARTVLFDKDMNTFRTTSAHAPHKIQAALERYTEEEWKKGVHFLIRKRVGQRQRTYHDIRIHPDMYQEET